MKRRNTVEDFLSKLQCDQATGCVLYMGPRQQNYGQFSFNGVNTPAHRFAWQLFHGEIPKGLTVDHLCKNPPCCNTDHMEIVTQVVNIRRGNSASAVNARVTHCPQGHPYSGDNLSLKKRPRYIQRVCKACKRDFYHRNKSRHTSLS